MKMWAFDFLLGIRYLSIRCSFYFPTDRLLSEPGIWERITKLAEALLVTNRIEIPHLAEFLQPISAP